MGLLDLLSAKVEHKTLQAKMAKNSLKALQTLQDMMAEATAPQDTTKNVTDTSIPSQTGAFNVNSDLATIPTKAPGTMTGNALLDQIIKVYPEHAATIVSKTNDPEYKIKSRVAEMFAGNGGVGGTNQIESLISQMTGNDPTVAAKAAGTGAMLEMGGVPIFKATERVQTGQTRTLSEKNYNLKKAEGVKEQYTDPTGSIFERYVDAESRQPIIGPSTDPAGWRKAQAAQLEGVDVVVPGKGKVRIWVQKGGEGGVALGPEDLTTITEQLPGGGEKTSTIPKSQPYSVTTKQPAGNIAIQGDELGLWVNPATLATATQGMTPDQAKAEGFQRISTQAKQSIDSLKAATVVVTEIKDLMNKVFPEKESFASPQRLLRPIGAAIQTSPDATRLFSLVNGTLAPIVRSLGEKGNLSDTDVKRAGKLVISGTDSAKVAREKTMGLLDLLGKIQRSTFSGSATAAQTKTVTPRKPGESAADYLKRTGG